jgi:hypothetical protein
MFSKIRFVNFRSCTGPHTGLQVVCRARRSTYKYDSRLSVRWATSTAVLQMYSGDLPILYNGGISSIRRYSLYLKRCSCCPGRGLLVRRFADSTFWCICTRVARHFTCTAVVFLYGSGLPVRRWSICSAVIYLCRGLLSVRQLYSCMYIGGLLARR